MKAGMGGGGEGAREGGTDLINTLACRGDQYYPALYKETLGRLW